MESHHPINKGKGMLWSDAPLRQLRGCSPDASVSPTSSSRSSPRPRSVVLVDPLPPSTAPLWRNAPNHHHQPPPARRNTPPNHATISPAVSFQQSLRSYPVSSFPSSSTSKGTVHNAATKLGAHPHQHQFNLHQPKNVAAEGPGSRRAGPGTGRLPQSKTVPAALSSAAAPKERTANKKQPSECHVTSLEGESSTPFFLDYLDSQSAMVAANPMLAQPLGAFNHRQFMEMFRSEPSSEQTNANAGQAANAAAAAAFSLSGAAAAGASGAAGGADDLGSLPYAVNTAFETGQQQPQFLLPEHYHLGARSSAAFDSLASTVGSDQQHSYSRPTPVDQRRSAPKSASLASAAAPGGYSKAENIVFRKAPSKTMDNKNSQSNSNISQRLQIAAERRTQIEEARRERVQRQIEQSPRPTVAAAMNSHGFNQNPSVAFGSTRPRNIDLTRPLVTPIPSARPKSEIFPSTFYAGAAHSGGGGGGSTQVDSSSSAYFSTPLKASSQHVFAKDDANYQPATRSPRTPLQPQQSTTTTPSLMSQSMIVPSSSSSNSGGSSNYRAARRHDPELVPAMQKYIFREYAMPTSASSGTPSLRKENSMISSMMSTKSFQQGPISSSSFYRTPFGGPQNRPKKSYSMNRLDQLAQPRRRVEPKVPTSASFVRPKMEPFTPSSKKPAPATEGGEGRVKPIPPPKTLFKSPRPQTAAAEPSSTSSPSAAAAATPAVPSRSRPATTPKPRPLSQIELSSTQSAAASAEEAANAAANEGEKEFEGSADDRLAEYKRALAEKRAMFRKQQEEQQLLQQQNPVRKAKIVKPEPAPVVAESEESKKAASSSSSSSSSSSEASDNEADNEDDEHKQQQNKPESVSTAVAAAAAPLSVELAQVSSEEAKKTASEAVPAPSQTSSVTESANVNSEQLISFGDSSPSAASPQVPPPRDVMTGDMMSTSLTGDLAALAINSGANSSRSEMAEKALAGASMTASLDLSLLNENKPGFSGNSKAGATTFTKEQLEERSAQLLQQQMAEREKRKSRVQEILKRTRKDEKAKEGASKQTDSNGSNGDSSQSENEANNGNNSDEASNEQAPVGTSSGGAEDGSSGSKFNGHNGESSGKATTADNGHSNGHLGSNHHRDMKTFVSENEQSLPPTNGF